MEQGSNIYIRNGSTLKLETDSRLEIHEDAYVYVENGSKLIVNANAVVSLHHDAYIVVKDGGTMIIEDDGIVSLSDDAHIIVEPGGKLIYRNKNVDLTQPLSEGITVGTPGSPSNAAEVRIEGGLHFENDSWFTYKGSGRYTFAGADAYVYFEDVLTGGVDINGPAAGFPVLRLEDGAYVDFHHLPVSLQNGLVEVHKSGRGKQTKSLCA